MVDDWMACLISSAGFGEAFLNASVAGSDCARHSFFSLGMPLLERRAPGEAPSLLLDSPSMDGLLIQLGDAPSRPTGQAPRTLAWAQLVHLPVPSAGDPSVHGAGAGWSGEEVDAEAV